VFRRVHIVIAFLSGMRESEVKHLKKGCLSHSLSTDGTIHRRKVTGLAFKGKAMCAEFKLLVRSH
jgi:hypothetical protein